MLYKISISVQKKCYKSWIFQFTFLGGKIFWGCKKRNGFDKLLIGICDLMEDFKTIKLFAL